MDIVVHDATGTRTFPLPEGTPVFIGRIKECDLCLRSPGVSRRHAVVLLRNGAVGIKDLGSSNGTYLNGQKLTHSQRVNIGDTILIAGITMTLQESPAATATPMPAADPAPEHRKEPTAARPQSPAPQPPVPAAIQPEPAEEADPAAVLDEPDYAVQPEPAPAAPEEQQPEPMALEAETPNPEPTPIPAEPESTESESVEPVSESIDNENSDTHADLAIPQPPSRPQLPPRAPIPEDEVAEDNAGSDENYSIEEEEEGSDGDAAQAALNKAAAEAGIVGEFSPDTGEGEETAGAEEGSHAAAAAGSSEAIALPPAGAGAAAAAAAAYEPLLPMDARMRQAIETRLCLYSFLVDLKKEREDFIARKPKMADPVKAELARQDREMDKIPNAQQALSMIEKRQAKRQALKDKIKEAKQNGTPPPPKPSRDMREAEEIAISQWTIIAESFSNALPHAYKECFRQAKHEPLVRQLHKIEVDPEPLLGGGIYYFALEQLQEETTLQRAAVREQLAALAALEAKKSGGSVLGRFKLKRKEESDEEDEDAEPAAEDAPAGNPEELKATEEHLAERLVGIKKELEFMEKTLISEFWTVYSKVALHFMPDHENMPLEVRAFLRHGALGFEKWWMKEDVRKHILEDCRDDVVHHMRISREETNILYADEYIAAVMNEECTPALDENLEINERNSPNWKADKALRKLINSRAQAALDKELINNLAEKIEGLETEIAGIDQQISAIVPGSKNEKGLKNELGQKKQSIHVEAVKMTKLVQKIKEETLAHLNEVIEETEQRFETSELPKPSQEFLIKREVDAVHKIGRLLANLKERFQPLVLRDSFFIGTDALNDRPAIRQEILEMERRDPAIFIETIVPSKKKASRVDLRISPVIVLVPSAGVLAYSWNPRSKPEDGRLAIPTCFIRRRIRERQITYLLSDFRWDTSKAAAGMDVMTSDTIVAAFMTVRWDWRKRSKEGREKGLIYNEQNDRTNWRRVYEAYSSTAYDGGKKLYNRNYDFYERIIGKYFDMPENVELLRK